MYDTFTGYVKKGFKGIFNNPVLFVPLLFNLLLTIIPMGIVFLIFGTNFDFLNFSNFTFPPKGSVIGIAVIIGIFMAFTYLLIYAGRYNMIKQAVLKNEATMDDFWEGIKKYTGKLFLGGLLIFAAIFLLIIIMIPIGMAIGANFIILILLFIPLIIVFIFISFWGTILIYEDCGIGEAFKLSWSFVKKHFGLVLIFNILRGIFTGDGNNNNNRRASGPSLNFNGFLNFNIPFSPDTIGIFSAVAIFLSAIKMFFALYFDMVFFIIYHDRRSSIFNDVEDDLLLNNDYDSSNLDDK